LLCLAGDKQEYTSLQKAARASWTRLENLRQTLGGQEKGGESYRLWKKEESQERAVFGRVQVQRAKLQEVKAQAAKVKAGKAEAGLAGVMAEVYDSVIQKIEDNQQARAVGQAYEKAWQFKKLTENLVRAAFLEKAVEAEMQRRHTRVRRERQMVQALKSGKGE